MIILTPYGQAVNAHHVTRIFLQADRQLTESLEQPVGVHVMLELASRRHLVAAASLPECQAQALFKELTRHWTHHRDLADVAAMLRRLAKGDLADVERQKVEPPWSM